MHPEGHKQSAVLDLAALADLAGVLRGDQLILEVEQLRTYDCDGLMRHRVIPAAVAIPETASEVQAVVRVCNSHKIPFVARGAGTGLSGGALPVAEGIVISLARFTKVVAIDVERGEITVEPGVANLDVTAAVAPHGFYYAPDPSSQQVCTIGGNVAENSGGAHCLKYGFTVNHVLAAEIVLPSGELVELSVWDAGPDLLGAFIGSEGTLGIATKLTLRILRAPEAVVTLLAGFAGMEEAGAAVSDVIAAGIIPAAVEMMDSITIEAAEAAVQAGYPPGCGAVLIVEFDGPAAQVEGDLERVVEICTLRRARETRTAQSAGDRARIWRGRKAAFAAMGRVSPNYYVQDGVVPRTRLPEVLRSIEELSQRAGLRVGNVFHAGDGNLHPLVLYDARIEGQAERAEALANEILTACVDAGGSITGEHGVGADKACAMPLMFSEQDLAAMQRLRRAFDPEGLANPGKVFPTPRLCGEVPGPYRVHAIELAGLGERL
ncbi:MAG: FAD-linked oxidase C-terminal domain-containing protein [Solirubrobacteraceae bacterium]